MPEEFFNAVGFVVVSSGFILFNVVSSVVIASIVVLSVVIASIVVFSVDIVSAIESGSCSVTTMKGVTGCEGAA